MIAAGIDIGGTKIEAQIFAGNWEKCDQNRIPTPDNYYDLVRAIASQHDWIVQNVPGQDRPVGCSLPGLINEKTGLATTSNLAATGKPFTQDLTLAANWNPVFVNDCRALALSESKFGAAQNVATVLALILGTGIGGGLAVDGALINDGRGVAGEYGHLPISGFLLEKYNLKARQCGCGRMGCYETYVSGAGICQLATDMGKGNFTARELAENRTNNDAAKDVWAAWKDLAGEMLTSLTLCIDPQVIVLGGGLSNIDNITDELSEALRAQHLSGFPVPEIRLAQGGDASGARGAAYLAWLRENNEND